MNFLKEKKKEILIFIFIVMLMGLLCWVIYEPLMSVFHHPQSLKESLHDFGIFGPLFIALAMTLQIVFVFLPGEIIEVMAGFFYGSVGGLFICMLGSALGSILVFQFVRKFGIAFVDKLLGKDKINNVHILQNPEKRNILLFIIFFIPGTPKDILTYLMPLTDMKLSTFLFITTIARIPSIITSTICGQAISSNQYLISLIVFLITGLVSMIGIYIYKKINKKSAIACHL